MDRRSSRGREPRWFQHVWHAQPGLLHGLALDVILPLALGIVTLVGGWQRVSGNGWLTMREYGGPYMWGTVLVLTGVALPLVTWLTNARALMWALRASAGVYALAALWFFNAAISVGNVSFWGVLFSSYVAATHVTRANLYRTADRYGDPS